WVVWEEDGRYPDLIIELLSDSTANVDRNAKLQLYAKRFHTPEYFYFSPDTLEFAGFKLNVDTYLPIPPNAQGWLWSESLGFFLGIHNRQLRYFSVEGAIVPTPQEAAKNEMFKANQAMQIAKRSDERAEQESKRAEQESQRAEQEKARADHLAAKLKELGIDPDDPN
ncbi:MAG: Uma2 family endonuclease, partial [Cylindrospermopsis raciborskii]|uniref:Uma2 family endonuclease n=1 Tax=Cylindrospermopsis raciborskii TaxID=77022 RepID=UPI003D0DC62A